jgi:hypothetical protein
METRPSRNFVEHFDSTHSALVNQLIIFGNKVKALPHPLIKKYLVFRRKSSENLQQKDHAHPNTIHTHHRLTAKPNRKTEQ